MSTSGLITLEVPWEFPIFLVELVFIATTNNAIVRLKLERTICWDRTLVLLVINVHFRNSSNTSRLKSSWKQQITYLFWTHLFFKWYSTIMITFTTHDILIFASYIGDTLHILWARRHILLGALLASDSRLCAGCDYLHQSVVQASSLWETWTGGKILWRELQK